MRLVVKTYANGARYVVETDNDATSVIRQEGERKPGERISAVIEVSADDSAAGLDGLLDAIRVVQSDIEQRKQDLP